MCRATWAVHRWEDTELKMDDWNAMEYWWILNTRLPKHSLNMTVFHLVQFRAMQPCHTLRDSEVFSSSPKPKTWDRGVLGLHEDQRCSPWDLRWGMLNGRFRTASDEMTICCFCIQLGIDVATSLRILPSWIRRSRKWRPFSVEGMGSHFFHTIAI